MRVLKTGCNRHGTQKGISRTKKEHRAVPSCILTPVTGELLAKETLQNVKIRQNAFLAVTLFVALLRSQRNFNLTRLICVKAIKIASTVMFF